MNIMMLVSFWIMVFSRYMLRSGIAGAYGSSGGFPSGASGKEPACQCRRLRDAGSLTGSGRSPREGHGNPLHCLENHMERGAWQATVPRVIESDTTEATQHTLSAYNQSQKCSDKRFRELVYVTEWIYTFQALPSKIPAFSMPMKQLRTVALPDIRSPATYRGVGRQGEGGHLGASCRWRHPPGLKKWGKSMLRQMWARWG